MDEKFLSLLEKISNNVERMQKDIQEVREDVKETNRRIDLLEEKTDLISTQVKENTQILKALEHASQIHKAELDKLNYDIAEISSDVKSVKHEFGLIEEVTVKNWNDILQLKKIKQ